MIATRRILITGATGFIGTRVCERLHQAGVPVRALVHSGSRAARIVHLPIETVTGDLCDKTFLREALKECDAVVHLAKGGRSDIVLATRNLVAAAARRGVSRFIHMSTTAVYGLDPPDTLQSEREPLKKVGESYCDWKIDAENAVWAGIRRGLPGVILRPCIVYGPHSRWNINMVEKLAKGDYRLVNEGRGWCNTVYVDNLIDAIEASLHRPAAIGEAFFITDEKPITWREFAEAHAALLTPSPRVGTITREEVEAFYRAQGGLLRRSTRPFLSLLISPELRDTLKTVPLFEYVLKSIGQRITPSQKTAIKGLARRDADVPKRTVDVPDMVTTMIQSCQVRFSSEKAGRLLEYVPRVSFTEGMKRTERWLAWAGHLRSARSRAVVESVPQAHREFVTSRAGNGGAA